MQVNELVVKKNVNGSVIIKKININTNLTLLGTTRKFQHMVSNISQHLPIINTEVAAI